MPQVEFIGDWQPEEAQQIAAQLQKSLSGEPGGGAEAAIAQLSDNPIESLLSKRQKKLLEMLRQAGTAALHGPELAKSLSTAVEDGGPEHVCGPDCAHSWQGYGSLEKAIVGQIKHTPKGAYRLNRANRWERLGSDNSSASQISQFQFTEEPGAFGSGVYLRVSDGPVGMMRLRLRLDIPPNAMISADEFYALESDFAQELDLMLTRQGVEAIAQAEGDRVTLLCVRSPSSIEVLGAVGGSGSLPPGTDWDYQLVSVTPQADHFTADVEVVPKGAALAKAATVFGGHLPRCEIIPADGPPLDRTLVREAVARCKADGAAIGQFELKLVAGPPDFLPQAQYAFCLPSEQVLHLINHDPLVALQRQQQMLSRRLQRAAELGAIAADEALMLLERAVGMDSKWWIESLIKRYTGAMLAVLADDITTSDGTYWRPYLNLLSGRGVAYWGDRQQIARCMAEDYRCAYDPAGLPNQVTMFWDVACPDLARQCQEQLLALLEPPLDKAAKHHVGEQKQKNGKTYELSPNHRWKRLRDAVVHEGDELGRNVAAWKIGKVVGGAVAQMAIAHGADPLAAEIVSETVVQAGAATAFYAAQGGRNARDLAAFYVAQAAAACMGKVAHHGAEQFLEMSGAGHFAQQAGAILAGKTTGIGTVVAAGKTGVNYSMVDAIASKAGRDLNLLRHIFGGLSKAAAPIPDEAIALLLDLTQAAYALAAAPLLADNGTGAPQGA